MTGLQPSIKVLIMTMRQEIDGTKLWFPKLLTEMIVKARFVQIFIFWWSLGLGFVANASFEESMIER